MTGSPPEPSRRPAVLVLNHSGENLDDLLRALGRSGLEVRETRSLAESHLLLQKERPAAVVLSPLTLSHGGIELEMLEALQRDDDPVPVLFLVDDLTPLAQAREWKLPIRDFLRKPPAVGEGLHRLELLLHHRRLYRGLLQKAQQLEGQISIDFKTGLYSEIHFNRLLALEWKRAQRHQNPLSLLMIDVDNFKRINDTTEYAFGDEVLRQVGETLSATVRETDFAARSGGDEFCVLLPHTTPAEAVQTAMRIRQRIAGMVVQKGAYTWQTTVSIGIDSFDGRAASSPEQLRRNANKALQEAKRRGKNQVWLFVGQPA